MYRQAPRRMAIVFFLIVMMLLAACTLGDVPQLRTVARFPLVSGTADWHPVIREWDGVPMALVPPGCFMMGSEGAEDVLVPRDDELPVQRQCVEIPFWIDRTEVTRGMYAECVATGVCSPVIRIPERTYRDTQPVMRVTWAQARAFCAWRGARLPTELEWEYAARGPESRVYPWGDTFEPEKVVCVLNAEGTADVASRPDGASWVGAYDMAGNVWEWTSSLYWPYPYNAMDGREDATARGWRVIRGGAWYDYESCDRAANRVRMVPYTTIRGIGFRCVRP